MAKLIVTRKKQIQGGLLALAVSVDGVERGGLRAGGRLEVDLSPGRHRVVAGSGGTVDVEVSADKETHVEVWMSPWNNRGKAAIKS